MKRIISELQAHRIKEDLQRNALSLNLFKNKACFLRELGKEKNLPLLTIIAEGIEGDVNLLKENLDALYNDMDGMLEGNGITS